MKYLKIILSAMLFATLFAGCDKDRFPEVENSGTAQFTREPATPPTTVAGFNTATLNKSAPAVGDKFTLKLIESGNVSSVKVMVDYRKAATPTVTTFSQQYKEITSWPQTYTVSLNDIVTLFAANGLTVAGLTANDKFVLRAVVTLKSGTVISEQAGLLLAAPYALTLTYTVAN